MDPFRLKGLELYSTVLWHMKREVELSHLAQEAVAMDRHSPYAWCVMGNCFSLQKVGAGPQGGAGGVGAGQGVAGALGGGSPAGEVVT